MQASLADNPDGTSGLPVIGELAELRLRCCEEAYQRRAWDEALEHHDALLELVSRLASLAPERSDRFWARYGELLAFLTAAVHGAVMPQSPDPPERALRAELFWQLVLRLCHASTLPIAAPDWLAVHEQQLVQHGAMLWCDLLEEGTAVRGLPPERVRQRALELLLRLEQLLDPAPDWVLSMALALVEGQAREVLEEARPTPERLADLLTTLEKLPVRGDRRDALVTALTRARLSLELLAPELVPSPPGGALQPAAQAPPDQERVPATPEIPGMAELVLLPPGAPASPLQLDLRPLLQAEFTQIEEALDAFCWHLPKGSRARPAVAALPLALEPLWRAGQRLEAMGFERLAYLASSWQRRLSDRLEPLPVQDWRYGLLVELAAGELDVLAPLLTTPQQLEGVLAELRREHHNADFWRQRQELPWMQIPPPLEALRRLHVEQGFYAGSHQPMESLRSWGRELLLAIGEAELWTDDSGCLGRWLAVAQELVVTQRGSLPALGCPPAPEQLLGELGGLEVVYVGDDAMAVQAAHSAGHCFRGEPFGLRVLETPASRWPARPADGFEQSLAVLLESVEALYRQRPFAVLLADCGAYRLPLLRAVHQRYGVAAISSGRPMAGWLTSSA